MPLEFTRFGETSKQDATGQAGPAEAAGQQPGSSHNLGD